MKISIVIPTKDRLESLEKCLESIASQKEFVGSVVIVASGRSAQSVVDKQGKYLEVEYIHVKKGGQIYQRNIGISALLDGGSEYIAFLNDDIVLLPNSLKNMCCYIKERVVNENGVIGVGFNIKNLPSYEETSFIFLKRILLRIGRRPGVVTKTGYNTDIVNVKKEIQTEWLGGGYTVWSAKILQRHPQIPVYANYSAGEDLIYSYPIGKKYPLFVCHTAWLSASHAGERQKEITTTKYRYFKATVARLYFCSQHNELSGSLYVVMDLFLHFLYLVTMNRRHWYAFNGFCKGVFYYIRFCSFGRDVLND